MKALYQRVKLPAAAEEMAKLRQLMGGWLQSKGSTLLARSSKVWW